MDLSGKTAIVTGASSGIGAATVRQLREAGVRVAGGARRVERVEADVALPLDVTDEASAALRRRGGRGARRGRHPLQQRRARARPCPFTESTAEDEETVLHTNVDGVLRMTRLCLPHIRDGGHIVFMGSIAGRQAYPNGASYIASKFAVRGFTYALREDLLGRPDPDHDGRRGARRDRVLGRPLRRRPGKADAVYEGIEPVTADEVADCVMFALTRPPHVNLDEIVIKAIAQSSGARVVRREHVPRRVRLRSPYDREILRFAVPALGALAAEPLYILVDTAIVGHLGRSQLAALGAAATVALGARDVQLPPVRDDGAGRPRKRRRRGAGRRAGSVRRRSGCRSPSASRSRSRSRSSPSRSSISSASRARRPTTRSRTCGSSRSAIPSVFLALGGQGFLRGVSELTSPLVVIVLGERGQRRARGAVRLRLRLGIEGSAWGTVIAQTCMGIAFVWLDRAARRSCRPRAGLSASPGGCSRSASSSSSAPPR